MSETGTRREEDGEGGGGVEVDWDGEDDDDVDEAEGWKDWGRCVVGLADLPPPPIEPEEGAVDVAVEDEEFLAARVKGVDPPLPPTDGAATSLDADGEDWEEVPTDCEAEAAIVDEEVSIVVPLPS